MSEVKEMTGTEAELFELDDNFDPLADMGLELGGEDERDDEERDYQAPIPDAELSHVPEPVGLPPAERIEKLAHGLPGQKFRLYALVELCREPKTLAEASAELEAGFPQRGSVYDAGILAELLVDAGALQVLRDERVAGAGAEGETTANEGASPAPSDANGDDEEGYLQVTRPPITRYMATEEGLALAAGAASVAAVAAVVAEEPRYLPLYATIARMTAVPGGVEAKAISDEIDDSELCKEPPRLSTYFLDRLERAGALRWDDTWQMTDLGRRALRSGVFGTEEA